MIHSEEVKRFWDERAIQYGTDARATLGETTLRKYEIKAILKYLKDGMRVLDAGCGNGYSTITFAQQRKLEIVGVDFSQEMVRFAKENFKRFIKRNDRQSKVEFVIGDVLNLPLASDLYDIVVTERCLQNLPSWEDQVRSILTIARVLKPRGLFVMCECSFTGLDHLGQFLNFLGRREPSGVVPWHNLFFCDEKLQSEPLIRKFFIPVKIDNFASAYTLITRVLPARLHFLTRYCPNFGEWGYNKIYLWQRRL